MITCGAVFVRTVEILIESDIKYYRPNSTRQRNAELDLILILILRWDGEIKKWVAIWENREAEGSESRFNWIWPVINAMIFRTIGHRCGLHLVFRSISSDLTTSGQHKMLMYCKQEPKHFVIWSLSQVVDQKPTAFVQWKTAYSCVKTNVLNV